MEFSLFTLLQQVYEEVVIFHLTDERTELHKDQWHPKVSDPLAWLKNEDTISFQGLDTIL